jgi:hypothetical protein
LDGEPPREVYLKERNIFSEHIDWAADGMSLLLVSHIGKMRELRELLRVDLSGNANILLQQNGLFRAVPSPDGRRLAILRRAASNNVWLLENF